MTQGQCKADNGEYLHEFEYEMDTDGRVFRNPNGHHISSDGTCDCSWDCCLVNDPDSTEVSLWGEYLCTCDECNGECGSKHR